MSNPSNQFARNLLIVVAVAAMAGAADPPSGAPKMATDHQVLKDGILEPLALVLAVDAVVAGRPTFPPVMLSRLRH